MRWPLWRVAVVEPSMVPTVYPGDWLLVWRGGRIRPGQLVVARHPGKPDLLLIKRAARKLQNGWWLESDSTAAGMVDSRVFGPVPPEFIEGRVVGRYRRGRR
ncbi:MAG TPA: nickel-type superoxide dismutase maturation protease [Streptosporangiaceae bacterium]|jgi:nickel-type superoxide dismutase maturation protease